MKIALVHDWLGSRVGGAEQVFYDLAAHFPEADLFALTHDKRVHASSLGQRKVTTSFLQHLPKHLKQRPAFLLPLMRRAVEGLDFSGYDLVISNSTAWVKNVKLPDGVKHLCYCHSPARMLWDSWPKYLESQHVGPFKLGAIGRFIVTRWASGLRLWDYYATERVSFLAGNSGYIAKRIKKFYGRSSTVLYPPVPTIERTNETPVRAEYYLVLSVLSRYKNIDLVIEACKANKRQLVIAGDGPDKSRLEAIAGGTPNVRFEGRVSEQRKAELLRGARGFIFPGIEDFGITPIEAMSVGTPVIALRAGGLEETVAEGVSGCFFNEPSVEALCSAIKEFEAKKWDPVKVKAGTEQYSPQIFIKNLDLIVQKVVTLP
jgi:glycosyltransferase involved in cell wall biosynthesis